MSDRRFMILLYFYGKGYHSFYVETESSREIYDFLFLLDVHTLYSIATQYVKDLQHFYEDRDILRNLLGEGLLTSRMCEIIEKVIEI